MICWYSELEEIETLAKEKGYTPTGNIPVLAVNRGELLSSSAVKKSLNVGLSNASCLALGELWSYQYEEVTQFLNRCHIEKDGTWLDEFDGMLSQVVYDQSDRIRAIVLCTGTEDGIFVDLLLGAANASEFLMTALQAFLRAASDYEKKGEDFIYMVSAQEIVLKLIRRVLDKKYEIAEIGSVRCVDDAEDADIAGACEQAAGTSLLQKNITWKIPWANEFKSAAKGS